MTETHQAARLDRAKDLMMLVASKTGPVGARHRIETISTLAFWIDGEAQGRLGHTISGATYHRMGDGAAPSDLAQRTLDMSRAGEITTSHQMGHAQVISRMTLAKGARPGRFSGEELRVIDDVIDRWGLHGDGEIANAARRQLDRMGAGLYQPVEPQAREIAKMVQIIGIRRRTADSRTPVGAGQV